MKKYEYQINMKFGDRVISACGIKGALTAHNLPTLLRRIIRKHSIKLEQIVLSFQPTDL